MGFGKNFANSFIRKAQIENSFGRLLRSHCLKLQSRLRATRQGL